MLKCEEQLASKESAVATAIKKKELAEELRRSDALLAKRIMTAQMKRAGGGGLPEPSGLEGSTMAAQLALAAQDEMQLRQMLIHTAEQLEAKTLQADLLAAETKAHRRRQLSQAVWLDDLGDASVAIRSSQFMLLGGLRMPRTQKLGRQGTGLSPAVAVLRQFGGEDGKYTAIGGSLLWDARDHEVSAVRLAMCTKPTPTQEFSLSFDHTGGLTASAKSQHDSLIMRVFGTIDLNRKGGSHAGVKLEYDLD
uniref:Uncharacterized protein n=1 Tax=Haptolina ericina TaxID=156174 RepID=A0A7S3AST3_9EUKA